MCVRMYRHRSGACVRSLAIYFAPRVRARACVRARVSTKVRRARGSTGVCRVTGCGWYHSFIESGIKAAVSRAVCFISLHLSDYRDHPRAGVIASTAAGLLAEPLA